ncbi:Atxe2 family lasso peptide isopeptidase [Sphingomonas sp. OTU376]|uniref:Atxe2 family lasso peptide isopeptidase n=1 Tax=Sphingomonas sp. OTU376 TaxID=3043863 RepID=UPI00313B62A7
MPGNPTSAGCGDPPRVSERRTVTVSDLARLADIGRSDPYDSDALFGVSPDRRQIAYLVRRGDPLTNSFCQELVIQDLRETKPALRIIVGGEFIRGTIAIWGIAALPTGSAAIVRPRWSPDGKSIAFLKRAAASTQIWIVASTGGSPRQATTLNADVDDFAWLANGHGFVVASRPALRTRAADYDREGRSGYLFDKRFSPMESRRPFVLDPVETRYAHIDIGSATDAVATPAEIALLDGLSTAGRPRQARLFAKGPDGALAWTESAQDGQWLGRDRIVIAGRTGGKRNCVADACAHVRRLWWQGGALFWISRVGWGQSRSALYRWGPEDRRPYRLIDTADNFIGCSHAGWIEICAREGASLPRRVESIDLLRGTTRTLFNPNAGIAARRLGGIHRYFYRNAFGVECWFDLVLPPDHRPGEKHPMVVVQYTSQGFLRGGTGDEVPIQALAARGIAVLSFEHPDFTPEARRAGNELELRQINRRNWLERRNVQDALEKAVKISIDTGTIDQSRIGISGFSEGSAAVQWALINSGLFSVASLGTCCEDKVAQPLNGGPGYARHLRDHGYPAFDDPSDQFWAPYSLAENADHIQTPILLQVGDSEYQMGLDVITAMNERQRPFETYVFPDEPHIKWQPVHRLAVYTRILDWFEFWLNHRIDCSPGRTSQYTRWLAMSGAPSRADLRCIPAQD